MQACAGDNERLCRASQISIAALLREKSELSRLHFGRCVLRAGLCSVLALRISHVCSPLLSHFCCELCSCFSAVVLDFACLAS